MVVCSEGKQQRFLRGMITHDLVQRGIDFDTAYATASAVRDQVGDRETIAASEVRDLVNAHIHEVLGVEGVVETPVSGEESPLVVVYGGARHRFSRGLLARSIYAAGPDLDRAYFLVGRLEAELRLEEVTVLQGGEIARRVGDLLEKFEGKEVARRYRVVRNLRRLPRPLVVYIGGSSGTGKSSLALELAPLLRIYRVNATDTIRQVMRMVFSQDILPAIHSSSFVVSDSYEQWSPGVTEASEENVDPQLTEYFEDQATRVLVGVRAVVERAIAENMSILVEGVHLLPPLVPFADLEGAAFQVPLVLATLDKEAHRSRFLNRARLGGRRAERFIEHFEAIRTIHDFVITRTEQHNLPLLDTSTGDPPVGRTLSLLAGMLRERLPVTSLDDSSKVTPSLLIVVDGMPDRPVRSLGGRTALQAADLPTFDRLVKEGVCGLADPIAPGVVPDTAAGSLALFGQSPSAMKRGPIEALGAGATLFLGDIAFRANLATVDQQGILVDRRAGRIRNEAVRLAKAIDRLPLPGSLAEEVEVRVLPATEHRLAIILRGDGLTSGVRGSDPGESAKHGPPLTPEPIDPHDERAIYTARVLALFEQQARKKLSKHRANTERRKQGLPPANVVLTRGAGRLHQLIPLEDSGIPLRVSCVAGDRTILGLASWLGAEIITHDEMTANLDTNLKRKFDTARQSLKKNDLVIMHLKGADIAAHDQRPDQKVAFLEAVDEQLASFLESYEGELRIAISADHATLSESGQHAADPVPVLLWGEGIEADEVKAFDEQSVSGGSLQRFPLQLLMTRLFDRNLSSDDS